jgi:tRNA A37 N6-isopentenylltransferase MiaA
MSWKPHTIHTMKTLYNTEKFSAWAEAVNSGATKELSENCKDLLERLVGLIHSEHHGKFSPNEYEKLIRVLEMAAVGGKTL